MSFRQFYRRHILYNFSCPGRNVDNFHISPSYAVFTSSLSRRSFAARISTEAFIMVRLLLSILLNNFFITFHQMVKCIILCRSDRIIIRYFLRFRNIIFPEAQIFRLIRRTFYQVVRIFVKAWNLKTSVSFNTIFHQMNHRSIYFVMTDIKILISIGFAT